MEEKPTTEKFTKLRFAREQNLITREYYWTEIKDFLNDLYSFSITEPSGRVSIEISSRGMIVSIPTSKTHTSYVKMYLDPNDVRSVPFSVLADGFYEPIQSDILIELGKCSESFLDIGANMGFYSLALAAENQNLKVNSFEPQPAVFEWLEKNIALNQMSKRINALNNGLGNVEDHLTMYIPTFTGSGGGSFYNLHPDEGQAKTINVVVHRLDNLELGKFDLLKIDVEGFEFQVLQGAQTLVNQSKPTIMVELLRKWMRPFGTSPQNFLDKVKSMGYSCFAITKTGLMEIDSINDDTVETNFVFCHRSRKTHFDLCEKWVGSAHQ